MSAPEAAPVRHVRLLAAAAEGDQAAWAELVDMFSPAMWASARAYDLTRADADDAVQAAWLRLLENLHGIHDPAGLGRWLITTTRREAMRISRERRGARLDADPAAPRAGRTALADADAAERVLDAEWRALLWRAVDAMGEPCRTLLRLLATGPATSTLQIAARLGMPRGSVGPTRARCLRRLRAMVGEAAS